MVEPSGHCPYLGLKQNQAIRFASPTPEHRCYVTGQAQDIPLVPSEYQAQFCLSSAHTRCPLYTGSGLPSTPIVDAAGAAAAPLPATRSATGWFAALPPRDRVIYGAMIVLLVAILGAILYAGAALLGGLNNPGGPAPTPAPTLAPAIIPPAVTATPTPTATTTLQPTPTAAPEATPSATATAAEAPPTSTPTAAPPTSTPTVFVFIPTLPPPPPTATNTPAPLLPIEPLPTEPLPTEPPTSTPEPPTLEPQPTSTPEPPTSTPELPTNTPELPTNTPEPPTSTPELPTNTPELPTNTPELPTEARTPLPERPELTPTN